MKVFIKFSVLAVIFSVFAFSALPAQAQWKYGQPIVPCGLSKNYDETSWDDRLDCTSCDLFRLIRNLMDFVLIGLVPALGTLFFIVAGFLWMMGGANPGLYTKGRAIFTSTFWGIVIILLSWTIANTVMATLISSPISFRMINGDNFEFNPLNWWVIDCTAVPGGLGGAGGGLGGGGGPPSGADVGLCGNPSGLAASLTVPARFPRSNSSDLNDLISCVNSRIGGMIDQNQLFTYERSNDLCNYTRGDPVCGACAHSRNSCHYGGATGRNGAEAVDFNAAAGVSEQALFNALKNIEQVCRFGYIAFESDDAGQAHTHISTIACDGN